MILSISLRKVHLVAIILVGVSRFTPATIGVIGHVTVVTSRHPGRLNRDVLELNRLSSSSRA